MNQTFVFCNIKKLTSCIFCFIDQGHKVCSIIFTDNQKSDASSECVQDLIFNYFHINQSEKLSKVFNKFKLETHIASNEKIRLSDLQDNTQN